MGTIIDAGHYYSAHGPTMWSRLGWQMGEAHKHENPKVGDKLLLFIDDVHSAEDLHPLERRKPVVVFQPAADHVLYESDMRNEAKEIFSILISLEKKKRPKQKWNMVLFWRANCRFVR